MRHREDYAQLSPLLFTSRPSLPRLKNKASLGRLSAYGGVLDFEVSSGVTVPAVPSFYRGTGTPSTSLAGPGSCNWSSSQDHNTDTFMHDSRSKQHQDEQHTPPKNTTQATLRTVKMLNREKLATINYDTASTTLPDDGGCRTGIPILDLDHPHRHQPPLQDAADQTGITIHSQSRLAHGTPTYPAESSSSHVVALQPASDSSSSSRFEAGVPVAGEPLSQEVKKGGGGEKDEDRLAREIREDMDEGGYASLEQILARNGFQVCRIATPPSTEKKVATTSRVVASTSIQPSITPAIPSSSSAANSPEEGTGLSKVISRSSSKATSKQKEPPQEVRHQSTFNTLKNKSSMLSFSGFVSTLWGQSASGPSTPHAHAHPNHATSFPNATTIIKTPTTETAPNMDTNDIYTPPKMMENDDGSPDGINTGGKRMDRNEDIKGWLRHTVEATNAYMNEARNAIEAAKLAMGSPEQKKSRPIIGGPSSTFQAGKIGATGGGRDTGIPASGSNSSLDTQRNEERHGEEDNDDLPLKIHERRQGTQSTLESAILETPTSSPTAAVHPTTIAGSASTTAPTQHVLLNSPPYSPPLKQGHQAEPQIVTMEAGYFDSPLMKKKMKRVSEVPIINGDARAGAKHAGHISSDAIASDVMEDMVGGGAREVSAEAMLRGTLRHALSESSLRREHAAASPDTVKKSSASKTGYRPSIATIFGIPMSFGTSSGSALASAEEGSSQAAMGDNHKNSGRNKLKDSTTESLTTESASIKTQSTSSTSAKDTSSSNTTNTAPKLLRKTASKHTLRKAASPILSNAIYVLRDEDIPTPTTVTVPANAGKGKTTSSAVDLDLTPVKSRPINLLRGPAPLPKALHKDDANAAAGKEDKKISADSSSNSGTPRQVAHRNPRDSPIGETRVLKKGPTSPLNVKRFPSGPPLALSSSSSAQNGRKAAQKQPSKQVQAQDTPVKKGEGRKGGQSPGIMDDQNDDSGLWSPPKSRTSSRKAPLGDTRSTQPTSSIAPSVQTQSQAQGGEGKAKKVEANKPRLKAKESLERILAYKQMQEETTASNETIPPVPALPPSTDVVASTIIETDNFTRNVSVNQAAINADTASAAVEIDTRAPISAEAPSRSGANTLKSKQSFTGTLRGILGSAVSGWTDSLPTISNDRSAPVSISRSSSTSKRVTILPANYSGLASTTTTPSNARQGTAKSNGRNKSIRRAKSMYVTEMESARLKRQEEEVASSIFGIGRNARRNSLILPTIIISDHTHD